MTPGPLRNSSAETNAFLRRHWETTADGKTTVGDLEIVVRSPGEWEQHITIETDGKRTSEWSIRHHRIQQPLFR